MDALNIPQLVQDVYDGNEDPIKAYAIAKDFIDSNKEGLQALYEAAIDEASKHPENTFEHEGFKITKKNGSKRFDYKHIEEWQQNNERKAEIEKKYKAAYNSFQVQLQAVSEDGEVLELPKVTQGKDSLSIKKL